jgi:hypothetical protein
MGSARWEEDVKISVSDDVTVSRRGAVKQEEADRSSEGGCRDRVFTNE